jgi:hypothetical protein
VVRLQPVLRRAAGGEPAGRGDHDQARPPPTSSDSVTRFLLQVLHVHESSSPKPLKITFGSFRIFSKNCGDIHKARCTTGINDTCGKFATSVKDADGKVATSLNYTRGKFATGVNDTSGK